MKITKFTPVSTNQVLADKLGDTLIFSLSRSCHKDGVEVMKKSGYMIVRDKKGRLFSDCVDKSRPLKSLRWYKQERILDIMLAMNLVHKDVIDLYRQRKQEADKFRDNAFEVEQASNAFSKLGLHFTSQQLRQMKKLMGPLEILDMDD